MAPTGGNGAGYRVLVRARVTDGRPGQVRVGGRLEGITPVTHAGRVGTADQEGAPVELDPRHAVVLEFAEGPASERFANLPAEVMGGAREARLVVVSSANIAIEALAVVPLADELPPPPKEPWTPVEEGPLPAPH